jgi:hypothetical protein
MQFYNTTNAQNIFIVSNDYYGYCGTKTGKVTFTVTSYAFAFFCPQSQNETAGMN